AAQPPESEDPAPAEGPEAPAQADLAARLAAMTTEEKVGQLFFARCAEPDMAEKIARCHLGGVLLFGRDYKDADGAWLSEAAFTQKLRAYQNAADVPLFIGSDEEGGTVTRATRNPNLFDAKLPSPQALYTAGGMDGLLTHTLAYNERLRALGVNVNFAPVCDVSTDPADFIYARAFGQDAAATADYAAQVVDVMGKAGIGCVLKHFPGYGNNVDTHTGIAIDARPIETFRSADFLPFQAGIDAGAPFVLVSHNVVNCLDAEYPASLSPAAYALLRAELGFSGVALTDDLAMDAVKAYADHGDAATLALLAGCDMVVTTDFETQIAQVLAAMADGTLPMETIDAAVLRVLTVKQQLGLL
ncbi:MAG: beta-hexosaminidase, partial [Oscillospiraceae bacterium]|nr:beta-hexosaminidase [Oscillospiraceae bacterium]